MADPIRLEAPVVGVELFEDRASVTRALALEAGRHRLRIGPVSPLVQAARVAFVGGVEVLLEDVEVRRTRRTRVEADPEALGALREAHEAARDAFEAAHDARVRAAARRARAEARVDAATEATPSALQRGEPPVRWLQAVRELASALRQAVEAEAEAEHALAVARDAHHDAEARLAAARECQPTDEAELWLSVVVATAGTAHLRYPLPCAMWRPQHHAERRGTTVHWTVQAACWNATGESWEGVALTCSTARPGAPSAPPPLDEDRLEVRRRDTEVVVEARDETITVARDGERAVAGALPGVDDGGEARVYVAPAPQTLPSSGRPVFVDLVQLELPCTERWEAVPEQGAAVIRRTRQVHHDRRPLLAGPVHLLHEGASVGRTQLELVPPGEPFDLGWGSHDALRVVRRLDHETDRTRLRGTHVHTFTVRTRLRHLGDGMLTVHLTERVPTSELPEVTVTVETTAPKAEGPDRDGFVRWALTVHPGDQHDLVLRYQVRAASRVVLPF